MENQSKLKLKKISPKNLTNEKVRAYNHRGQAATGYLKKSEFPENGINCTPEDGGEVIANISHVYLIPDIDKEAKRQMKEMNQGKK